MEEQIAKLLLSHAALPVLFVGSGLSRRYLNLPNWEGLLKQYCIDKPYEYSFDKASRACRETPEMIMPTVADYIEEDYNRVWYTSEEFKESRVEHKEELERKISPLKISIADYFRKNSSQVVEEYKEEIDLLSKIGNKNISCIITTNYDCFIENCFGEQQFQTYVGQDDLLFSTTYEVGELYKIHGCCKKAESIVINADDYAKFIKKNAYLSSKILTMFLERPIIFLGYGINDADIMRILDSIADCLENSQLDRLSERLLFVERNRDKNKPDAISSRRITTQSGKTVSMQNILLYDYSSLYKAILQNQAKYDVRVLRRIKSQLYELVAQNKPTEKLYIATNLEDEDQNVDFVVGVGVYGKFGIVGYRGVKAEELYLYILGRSARQFDESMLLKETIPSLYNGRTTFPVCQLITRCTDRDCINEKVKSSLKNSFSDILSDGEKGRIRANGYYEIGESIVRHYELHGLGKTLSKIPLMNPSSIDIEDLRKFLNKALDDDNSLLDTTVGRIHPSRSQFKKCISIWDWLAYGNVAKERIKSLDA